MNSLPAVIEKHETELGGPRFKSTTIENHRALSECNKNVPRRILLVEEDVSVAGFLRGELEFHGFQVEHFRDGEEALIGLLEGGRYDLLILELNLPKVDGVKLIERIRPARPRLPVLVVSSRNRIEDKVTALYSGADDFVTKPFSLVELLARVRALLRRNGGMAPDISTVGDLTLHREEHRVERGGRRIVLTPREFALLDVMMQNAGHPVDRTTLLEQVWSTSGHPSTNVVDVYMKYVRDKVDLPGEPRLIHTVRGFGYELRVED